MVPKAKFLRRLVGRNEENLDRKVRKEEDNSFLRKKETEKEKEREGEKRKWGERAKGRKREREGRKDVPVQANLCLNVTIEQKNLSKLQADMF